MQSSWVTGGRGERGQYIAEKRVLEERIWAQGGSQAAFHKEVLLTLNAEGRDGLRGLVQPGIWRNFTRSKDSLVHQNKQEMLSPLWVVSDSQPPMSLPRSDPGREGLLPKEMMEFIPLGWRRFISKADASLEGRSGPWRQELGVGLKQKLRPWEWMSSWRK